MDNEERILQIATDRFERRLAEETGKLRVEMATGFGSVRAEIGGLRAESGGLRAEMAEGFGRLRTEMAEGFGRLRTEMVERNQELLKWAMVFGATLLGAIAALLALLR